MYTKKGFVILCACLLLYSFRLRNFEQKITCAIDTIHFENNYFPSTLIGGQLVIHSGYRLCYIEKNEQALWVAYRLTAAMCGTTGVKRSDHFKADPSVTSGSATPEDYKNSGYDRGHLCPAGDMKWSQQAMEESFYMSNMSPQKPGFNRGIWKKLEEKTRNWAISNEELFIVTAGILNTDSLSVIGVANKVSVPKYFYKVLLDYRAPELKAIGFIMENNSSKRSVFNYAVPVDSVEKLTGINFYPALPDSIENKLEATIDTTLWK